MRNTRIVFACAVALGLTCASPGNAVTMPPAFAIIKAATPHILTISDRGYYDEDVDDEEEIDDPPQQAPRYSQPPDDDAVPEWLPPPRPANCGEYKYWNGAYCADARVQPPYVGPRW